VLDGWGRGETYFVLLGLDVGGYGDAVGVDGGLFGGHADVDDAALGALAHCHCAEGAFDGEVVADHGGHESFGGHVFLGLGWGWGVGDGGRRGDGPVRSSVYRWLCVCLSSVNGGCDGGAS